VSAGPDQGQGSIVIEAKATQPAASPTYE
jgi:hypothetical protein